MNREWVRKYCMSLPHVTEQVQWQIDLVFKIGGKMFAIVVLEPHATCLAFKCSPEDFEDLIERPGIIPAPYIARAKWLRSNPSMPCRAKNSSRGSNEPMN